MTRAGPARARGTDLVQVSAADLALRDRRRRCGAPLGAGGDVRGPRGRRRRERVGPDLYPVARRLRLGPVLASLGTVLILIALVGGLFSTTEQSTEFFENPVTLLTWVDFWVGLGIVSWLVGNVWERVSPLNIAARALDRALAVRDVQPLAYPAWLGQRPAVALLLVWSWMELIWGPAKEPRTLALLLVGYMIATLAGSAVFGAEAWLGNVELFSVFARTLSRFSPLELRPFVPEEWASTDPSERTRAAASLRRRPAHRSGAAGRGRRVRPDDAGDGRLRRLVADRPVRLVPAVVLRPMVVSRAPRRRAADALDGRGRRRVRRRVRPRHARARVGARGDADPDRRRLLHRALLRVPLDRRRGHAGRDRRSVRAQLEPVRVGRVRALEGDRACRARLVDCRCS